MCDYIITINIRSFLAESHRKDVDRRLVSFSVFDKSDVMAWCQIGVREVNPSRADRTRALQPPESMVTFAFPPHFRVSQCSLIARLALPWLSSLSSRHLLLSFVRFSPMRSRLRLPPPTPPSVARLPHLFQLSLPLLHLSCSSHRQHSLSNIPFWRVPCRVPGAFAAVAEPADDLAVPLVDADAVELPFSHWN